MTEIGAWILGSLGVSFLLAWAFGSWLYWMRKYDELLEEHVRTLRQINQLSREHANMLKLLKSQGYGNEVYK